MISCIILLQSFVFVIICMSQCSSILLHVTFLAIYVLCQVLCRIVVVEHLGPCFKTKLETQV